METVAGVFGLLKDSGFGITKFATNNEVLLSHIPVEDRVAAVEELQTKSHCTASSVKWDVFEDKLYVDVNLISLLDGVTMRKMLNFFSPLFDPLELVGPLLTHGRIIFQIAT